MGEFWPKAQELIWTGGAPLAGRAKFTFWHVMFFAWFCNMAMHIGMADLSVFRYARKSWYAVGTAAGMYLGHFIAWLSASILYAQQLHATPDNTAVLPGPLAYNAAGIAGVLCVIVAGWTTANPTIYRAGLAFQAISPSSSRYRVTLLTGALATVAGMFPAIAMKLLDFVALYGLVLMPMGAVVFVDFWLAGRFGFRSRYAEASGVSINWAAAVAWVATLAAVPRGGEHGRHADLLRRPAGLVRRRAPLHRHEPCAAAEGGAVVKRAAQAGVARRAGRRPSLPPVLYLRGPHGRSMPTKWWMLVAAVAWFAATPMWMDRMSW
ncbi:MAG: hypothetical protein MZW92_42385 [Comamonadaceae bacterium]|nr:hypothetical protein [Comamonadaceae bacterium]